MINTNTNSLSDLSPKSNSTRSLRCDTGGSSIIGENNDDSSSNILTQLHNNNELCSSHNYIIMDNGRRICDRCQDEDYNAKIDVGGAHIQYLPHPIIRKRTLRSYINKLFMNTYFLFYNS